MSYYAKVLPDRATKLAPLYQLLQKDTQWGWSDNHEQSLEEVKQLLSSPKLLVRFDDQKPIVLACDAWLN